MARAFKSFPESCDTWSVRCVLSVEPNEAWGMVGLDILGVIMAQVHACSLAAITVRALSIMQKWACRVFTGRGPFSSLCNATSAGLLLLMFSLVVSLTYVISRKVRRFITWRVLYSNGKLLLVWCCIHCLNALNAEMHWVPIERGANMDSTMCHNFSRAEDTYMHPAVLTYTILKKHISYCYIQVKQLPSYFRVNGDPCRSPGTHMLFDLQICWGKCHSLTSFFVFLAKIEGVMNMIRTFNEHPRFYLERKLAS